MYPTDPALNGERIESAKREAVHRAEQLQPVVKREPKVVIDEPFNYGKYDDNGDLRKRR